MGCEGFCLLLIIIFQSTMKLIIYYQYRSLTEMKLIISAQKIKTKVIINFRVRSIIQVKLNVIFQFRNLIKSKFIINFRCTSLIEMNLIIYFGSLTETKSIYFA